MARPAVPSLMACLLALLAACTTVRFEGTEGRLDVHPEQAAGSSGVVVWGGRIEAAVYVGQGTRMEVLAFPLSDRNVPRAGEDPVGRFIAVVPARLDLRRYAPGRFVSLAAELAASEEGGPGTRSRRLIEVHATQLHLFY